ncbi:hypothetical protein FVEG_07425 [Fusarium verticillioides 7600]|uniref:Uncharacterized protein n=1 Tax=Gibberella moniliformis (strain M3125 / FGSC 7600) TaxID=334819 RepID=W7MI74_GIBM7|nr:hypothetical protein FVEG_07425 [Fusarium verticillioides 7600]EWG47280.1 hypothetical protein FVEG_07425 [Fusarium verticillioides 7600]
MASAYSQEKLSQFFDHIDLPKSLRKDIRPSLMLLKALHTHSLATFPYENLSLHYNTTHSIDLGPQHLFRKMVADRRGRGGFTRGRLEGVPRGDYPGQAKPNKSDSREIRSFIKSTRQKRLNSGSISIETAKTKSGTLSTRFLASSSSLWTGML